VGAAMHLLALGKTDAAMRLLRRAQVVHATHEMRLPSTIVTTAADRLAVRSIPSERQLKRLSRLQQHHRAAGPACRGITPDAPPSADHLQTRGQTNALARPSSRRWLPLAAWRSVLNGTKLRRRLTATVIRALLILMPFW
jgi:hypothetical protein